MADYKGYARTRFVTALAKGPVVTKVSQPNGVDVVSVFLGDKRDCWPKQNVPYNLAYKVFDECAGKDALATLLPEDCQAQITDGPNLSTIESVTYEFKVDQEHTERATAQVIEAIETLGWEKL